MKSRVQSPRTKYRVRVDSFQLTRGVISHSKPPIILQPNPGHHHTIHSSNPKQPPRPLFGIGEFFIVITRVVFDKILDANIVILIVVLVVFIVVIVVTIILI